MKAIARALLVAGLCTASLAPAAPAQAAFGFKALDVEYLNEDTTPATLAGSHPFLQRTTVAFNIEPNPGFSFEIPSGDLKDLSVVLPPGFVADTTAVPRCPQADFVEVECDSATQVGINEVVIGDPPGSPGNTETVPLYNLPPKPGTVAKFGFVVIQVPITLEVKLSQQFPYNGLVTIDDSPEAVPIYSSTVSIWGVSPDSGAPFLTLPTSCEAAVPTAFSATSWQEPDAAPVGGISASSLQMEECDELEFEPTIEFQPTNSAADSPTGLDFDLRFDDAGLLDADGRAQSALEKAVVTLPEGVTTNPAVAAGLGACSLAQYEAETLSSEPGAGCPQSSKVGSVEIESPLIEPMIEGEIFVAKQHDNPFGNLLTIYMVAGDPELGILVKQAGRVNPDPQTGQLTTTFEDLPQLPFSRFRLHLRGGDRAPLITPAICGSHRVAALLYPYSDPDTPTERSASLTVGAAPGGTFCATTQEELPNAPAFSAGTVLPRAGAFSPFVLDLARADGSQRIAAISATLPAGLLGRLAGVQRCGDAQIALAQSRDEEGAGAAELAFPSCPDGSLLGTVTVASGAGPRPYLVSGRAYLAGPYGGAPVSMAIVTPAVAGPFDLGVVTVRTPLVVDPLTAQITAASDPIPALLHGLPLVVRRVSVEIARDRFILNPTSCEPKAFTGLARSTLGFVAPLHSFFQATDCGNLGFAPKLSLRLKGRTRRTANPVLSTTYEPRPSDANVRALQVKLPRSAFLDNAHIGDVCTRVQFAVGACPSSSVYGVVSATTPLLDESLAGAVYLRSSSNPLPDLVVDLHGPPSMPVRAVLAGRTDSVKGALRTTFEALPDVPVSRVAVTLFGGRRGLVEMSSGFCKRPRAAIRLAAHNGLGLSARPRVASSCKKHRR